jgi:phosphatidylglycerophosphate synthase
MSHALWRTRANGLTLLRLLAAPALAAAIFSGHAAAALWLFALAVATDFADGWVARRFEEQSPMGGVIDHAVDATFVTLSTGALACAGVLPAALAPLIAVAFLQYVLDSRALASRGLRPSALGRWNGIAYYVAVGVPVVRDGLGLSWPGADLVEAIGWLLVASTLLSMLDRLRLLLRLRG